MIRNILVLLLVCFAACAFAATPDNGAAPKDQNIKNADEAAAGDIKDGGKKVKAKSGSSNIKAPPKAEVTTPAQPEQPKVSQPAVKPIDMEGTIAAGLNYPGISVRYGVSGSIVLEGKYQSGEGISLFGPRLYYYFSRVAPRVLVFAGGGVDSLTFKGDDSEGTGFVSELFAGGEYFVNDKLSVQLDMGPAFIDLVDKNYSITQSGLEYVVNFGINYYFGPGGKER